MAKGKRTPPTTTTGSDAARLDKERAACWRNAIDVLESVLVKRDMMKSARAGDTQQQTNEEESNDLCRSIHLWEIRRVEHFFREAEENGEKVSRAHAKINPIRVNEPSRQGGTRTLLTRTKVGRG